MMIRGRSNSDGDGEWKYPLQVPLVTKSMGLARLFRFEPARMMEASAEVGTSLRPDGYGLASTLALLALNQPETFAVIQREFKSIIPFMRGIRFDRFRSKVAQEVLDASGNSKRELFPVTLDQILFDLENNTTVTTRGVSEGTLLVLGLLSALHGWGLDKPNLVLLDDLDRGLHPLAQMNIINLLRKVMEKQPDLQIVATTHSPYLLDSLRPEEVRLTTLNDDGSVACGRLVDHPKFEQWKNEMAPGEMWSLFGEKWVSQSPTQPAETL